MKKLTALLALFLLLALLAQGACAAPKISLWYGVKPDLIRQDSSVLTGSPSPKPSINNYAVSISSIDKPERDTLIDTFNEFYADQPLAPSDSGYTRNALLVNMQLMGRHDTSTSDNDDDYDEISIAPDSTVTYSPVIPLTNFIPEGTTFQNLKVFHYTQSDGADSALTWESVESVLHDGKPDFDSSGTAFKSDNEVNVFPVASKSDHYLRLSVGHFSPFVIVWDELNTGAPDVPQTGDSAPLALWLLLLGGACALLALRRRSQRAS